MENLSYNYQLNSSSNHVECSIVKMTEFSCNDEELDDSNESNKFNLFDSPVKESPQTSRITSLVTLDSGINSESLAPESNTEYFYAKIPRESSFQLSTEDWNKLCSLQKSHRFLRGEWEDYFILGMKESNKYCVFAFKDHYVNQTSVRRRKANMNKVTKGSICADSPVLAELKGKKLFSANGYCVFENCPIRFLLKMNSERVVHVFYEGEIRHSLNEVRARYFRGKSRHELKEVLKYSTPLKEYLQRVRSSATCNLESGNADYVGKSSSVYRRISSEAKDCYQALLQLRHQLIQKSLAAIQQTLAKTNQLCDENKINDRYCLGFIQMIQHIPGSIICYDFFQVRYFHSMFVRANNCLHLSCYRTTPLVSTTINSKSIFYFEMSIRNGNSLQLVPLSSMLTTSPNSVSVIDQWLRMFLESEKRAFCQGINDSSPGEARTKYVLCDNSMALVEAVLDCFSRQSFEDYSNQCFVDMFNKQKDQNDLTGVQFNEVNSELFCILSERNLTFLTPPRFLVHTCTDQLMQQIHKLCRLHYSTGNNFNFGMHAFSVIINSESLFELQQSMYSFMCILYSGSINSLVEKAFEYLKLRVNHFENLNRSAKTNSDTGYYFYNSNSAPELTESENDQNANIGLNALGNNKNKIDECKLSSLNRSSMFYVMCEKIFEKCKFDIDRFEREEVTGAKNPRQGHQLLYHFVQEFSATLPLWTKINISTDEASAHERPLTLHAQTERFRLMHSQFTLEYEEKEKETLDTFIKRLSEETKQDDCEISEALCFYEPAKTVFSQLVNVGESNISCEIESEVQSEFENMKQKTNRHDLIRVGSIQNFPVASKARTNKIQLKRKSSKTDNENEDDEWRKTATASYNEEIVIEREHERLGNDFGFELSNEDLESLDSSPNSNIIEFYLKMLEKKVNMNSSVDGNFKVLVYSVSFYPDLKYECELKKMNVADPEERRSCSSIEKNIFGYNLVLIPIQKCNNWTLAAIDFRKQKITYNDPLLFNDFDCLKHLTDYIEKEFLHREGTKFDFRNWKISNEKNIPKNIDIKDSGIFVLLYAKRLINNQDLLFKSSEEISNFRTQLKNEIFQFLFAV